MAVAQFERPKLTPSNGHRAEEKMQETVHLPEALPLGMRLREHLKKAQVMVEKAGGVLPSWAAPVLLGAVLTAGGFVYMDFRSTQREQLEKIDKLAESLLILKTQREASEAQRAKEEKEAKEERDMNRLWRETLDKRMARLEMGRIN